MKNNVREKMFSLILLMGGLVIMLTVTGFTSGFSIVKNNESRQLETVNHKPENPAVPASVLDTVPDVDWDEIKKEMEEAKIEVKKAIEEIDWEEMKMEMSGVKLHLDSVLQDIDFDFDDLDVDTDFDFDFDDLDVDVDFDHLEMAMDSIPSEVVY
jgi:hypothetical protein